ncbi:MAG TPA: radical SAM protein [Candidatus Bathyarchaeota archaeon]|nr:radical SAM protein [Candidatus Bathyarchaeota archaeon]
MQHATKPSTVYGPVPSWRLGRSLGVDPILPPKACTFDCIYCQLGKTKRRVSVQEWQVSEVDVDRVIKDLEKALARIPLRSIDYVTFSGSGEPTLNPGLGDMIRAVKDRVGEVPVAVLTNASLVYLDAVRRSLAEADLVAAKLDAPNEPLFQTINRPVSGIHLDAVVEGLCRLRSELTGRLALQVMLLRTKDGRKLNSDPSALESLVELARRIDPDEVQLNTPTRPPSEAYVVPLARGEMSEAKRLFAEAGLRAVSVYEAGVPARVEASHVSLEQDVLLLLRRRPCRVLDVSRALGISEEEALQALERLASSGAVSVKVFRGERYYRVVGGS